MRVSLKQFVRELKQEISDDNVPNGAAALAYYFMLSIFPAAIFLLTLLPYLPIPNLEQQIMQSLGQFLPGESANLVSGVVRQIISQQRGGLLSFGALFTLWSASSGMAAVMQQLNITYDIKESRPFWKTRGIAIMLTALFGVLVIGALAMIIFGDQIHDWLATKVQLQSALLAAIAIFRWAVVVAALLLAFALTYYWGPDVDQRFRFITPGSAIGVALLILTSLGFKVYVTNFGKYNVTYGSLGAVIVLMLWLNIAGLVILLGSEINALIEHHSINGKEKGEKKAPPEGVRKSRPEEPPGRVA